MTKNSKDTYSNVILLVFALFLVIVTAFSEFFRNPGEINAELNKYRNLFTKEELGDINHFTLINRLGTFKFKRVSDNPSWFMEGPRELPVDISVIEKIISPLENIKIREVYHNDAINYSNYSLDSPLMELIIRDSSGKDNRIKFGLVNPIDETTYIYTSKDDAIYHVDAFSHSLESLDLADFREGPLREST